MSEFICLKSFLKLSIVVPVFNNEKSISKCISSLINQSFDFNTYEILIVNDGSTDQSVEIINQFINQYNFIRLINKQNGGELSAMNLGIKHARGKFITFINPNSVVTNNLFINFISTIESKMLDGFCFAITDDIQNIDAYNAEYSPMEKNDLIKNENKLFIYRTSIIKQNNILFNEAIRYKCHISFNYKYIQSCLSALGSSNQKLCYYPKMNKNYLELDKYYSYLALGNDIKSYKLSNNASKELQSKLLTTQLYEFLWCVIKNKYNANKALRDLKQNNLQLSDISYKETYYSNKKDKFKNYLQYQFRHQFVFKFTCLIVKLFKRK